MSDIHSPYALGSREEKRAFAARTFKTALPIALQNAMDAGVGAADTLMLSLVGQAQLSAASLAGTVAFMLNMLMYGISSGAGVLTAQHWGSGDHDIIERVLGLALRLAITVAALLSLAALIIPDSLMRIFTNDEVLIAEGAKYLRVVSASYTLGAFASVYLGVQRSVERVTFSAAVHSSAVLLNVVLNAAFIYGFWFFPKLGIVGVALATSITRCIEVLVCLIDNARGPVIALRAKYMVSRGRALLRRFMRYTLPATANDVIWGLGFSMYSVILGHLSSDIVAANSVASVVRGMGTVLCFGMSSSAAIILGKTMGEGLLTQARVWAGRFARLSLYTALLGGTLILLSRPLVLRYMYLYVEVTDVVRAELDAMLLINSYYVIGQSVNTMLICGIFRAGGDMRFGLLCDSAAMWLYAVPVGLLCAFVFKLPEMTVYFILCLDEFVKMPVILHHYFKRGWIQNLTRNAQTGKSVTG